MSRLVRLAVLLALSVHASASSSEVILSVRPEVLMTPAGDSAVRVRVRLAPGAVAKVWADIDCGTPAADSQQVTRSGDFLIRFQAQASQTKVCLASSDQLLNASLSLGAR